MFMPALAKFHLAHHTHFHNPLSFLNEIWQLRLHPNAKLDRPIIGKGLEMEGNVNTAMAKFFLYNLTLVCDLRYLSYSILEFLEKLFDWEKIQVSLLYFFRANSCFKTFRQSLLNVDFCSFQNFMCILRSLVETLKLITLNIYFKLYILFPKTCNSTAATPVFTVHSAPIVCLLLMEEWGLPIFSC